MALRVRFAVRIWCHVMSGVVSCHVALNRVISSHIMSCYDVMPCYVRSCHVMSCRVVSCLVVLYRALSNRGASRRFAEIGCRILTQLFTLTLRKRTPPTLTQLIFIPLAFAQLTLAPLTLVRPYNSAYQSDLPISSAYPYLLLKFCMGVIRSYYYILLYFLA